MAASKLAEATFYGVSVSDSFYFGIYASFLLSVCPRLQLCRARVSFSNALTLSAFLSVTRSHVVDPSI